MSDPYEVLGLPRHADEAEIRRRYLELVREFPPDRDPERFTAIRAAYDAVRDPVRRLEAQLFELDTSDSLDAFVVRSPGSAVPAPDPAGHPARAGGVAMTGPPDDEALLAQFRLWLHEARAEAEAVAREGGPPSRRAKTARSGSSAWSRNSRRSGTS